MDSEWAYWHFDAMHKGYGDYRETPLSERDAFKRTFDKAMAEKDREYAQLKEAYDAKVAGVPLGPIIGAQTILNQQIAYNQLMEQAVYFAEIADSVCRPSGLHGAAAAARFLASPAVQQWRKEQGV